MPFGYWQTATFIAALRNDRVEAPWLLNGAINSESFLVYVEQIRVPTLKPGDVSVMDNLGSHKGKAVRQATRTAGAKLLFLPNIPPLSTPSSNSSPSSSTTCAAPPSERTTRSATTSQNLPTVPATERQNYLANVNMNKPNSSRFSFRPLRALIDR